MRQNAKNNPNSFKSAIRICFGKNNIFTGVNFAVVTNVGVNAWPCINSLLLLRLWKHDTRFQCLFARKADRARERQGKRQREQEERMRARSRWYERDMLWVGVGARETGRRKDYEARHLAPRSQAHTYVPCGLCRDLAEKSPTFYSPVVERRFALAKANGTRLRGYLCTYMCEYAIAAYVQRLSKRLSRSIHGQQRKTND